jgi:HSP20 family protein
VIVPYTHLFAIRETSEISKNRDCPGLLRRYVVADMPGVDENSVDITLEQNVLTIDGYAAPVEPKGHRLAYAEYRVGDYQRRFTLSDQIDRDKIEATVKDGVLRLHLSKVAPTARKIAVKAG